ncbi:MAG: hypothetical protein ABGX83_01185 [Nitrospira sp.]|nr:hypothetical protein [Candidatus Manganitrophaceae bacterium]HIL35169.1 hypothetical protein [Candidatus Manganitrophaceae bacterium]
MNCPRCHGRMAPETFQDLHDDTGRLCFSGYRCMACGEILDPVIMSNRENRPHMQARNRNLMSASRR